MDNYRMAIYNDFMKWFRVRYPEWYGNYHSVIELPAADGGMPGLKEDHSLSKEMRIRLKSIIEAYREEEIGN